MGGVPVLLALAIVGVDYGYQPDGDGGIDYIVQVSPEHWEQARDAGEITSVVDPSVRGRVNRIIIRIGDGELPREMGEPPQHTDDAGAASDPVSGSPDADASAASTADLADRRIASTDETFVPPPALVAAAGGSAIDLAARVMRPDPQAGQAGGFALPNDESGGAENSAGRADATRGSSGNSARATEDALQRLSGGDGTARAQPSGSQSAPSSSTPNRGSEARVQPPSTEPRSTATGRDASDWNADPSPGRPSTRSAGSEAGGSSGAPSPAGGNGASAAAPSSGFGTQPGTSGFGGSSYGRTASGPSSPYGSENGNSATAVSSDASAAANGGSYAPQGSSSSGYGNGFGNDSRVTQGQAANQSSDPYAYANTPASLQDRRVAGYDQQGRPRNAAGQIIPDAAPLAHQNAPSEPLDRGYGPGGYQQPAQDPYAAAGPANQWDRSRAPSARLASEAGGAPAYGRSPTPSPAPAAEPASPSDGSSPRSSVERDIAAELAAARAALRADAEKAEEKSVVTQPVFNFLLLVSLVANAYLILTMSKLLQRYRSVVANTRSASTSPNAAS